MADVPPTHELLSAFQEFLREAIQLSCGDNANIIDDYPVAYGNAWKSNGDFQCFVAAAIFSKTIGLQNKVQAALQGPCSAGGGGGDTDGEKGQAKKVSA